MGRQLEDDLLPHRAAVAVLEVVDLVEDHHAQIVEIGATRVDHVSKHFGGHHHDLSVSVDGVVTGQQTDPLGSEAVAEVAELLVRERLYRCRVERAQPLAGSGIDGVVGNERLSRPCRSRDQHGSAIVEGVEREALEPIDPKAERGLPVVAVHFFARLRVMSTPMRIDTS